MTIKEREAPKIPFTPYLLHPVKGKPVISEAYIYSKWEWSMHHAYWHKGIDYCTTYGVPVYATAAGYAVASYHRFIVLNRDNTLSLFDGKPMANGFGYLVQIYHPEKVCGIKGGRITQYAHLGSIKGIRIKVTKPIKIDHISRITNAHKEGSALPIKEKLTQAKKIMKSFPWVNRAFGFSFTKEIESKESYIYSPEEMENLCRKGNKEVVWVEAGQQIGTVGSSAVFAEKPNYMEGDTNPNIPEPNNNWDEFHLHFEEAERDWETGYKKQRRDPYDIYKSYIWYTPRYIEKTLFLDNPF